MEFKDSYFEGEIREGFYVQPLIKRAWAAQLEVLREIEIICKRHGIKYYAEWGTLLGAVRHKGYIPWDDDLDIGMMRRDFERFRHYAPGELPEGYCFLDIKTEGFDEQLVRIVNSDKIDLNVKFLEKFHDCPYAIGVDIFCMDNIPPNKEEEQIVLNLLASADSLGRQWDSTEIPEEEKWDDLRQIEELTGFHFDKERPVKKQLLQLSDKISAMYWDDKDSEEVSFLFLLVTRPHYRLPVSCFESLIDMPFENTMIPVPVGYDQVLKLRYGTNYIEPVRKWGTHDYPYFKDQIEILKNVLRERGMELPERYDINSGEKETE